MSVSAVAPTPFYQDPDRLPIGLPAANRDSKAEATTAESGGDKHLSMFAEGDDSPSFWDVLDIINPLQHIPIVNDIYRDLTGDKIGVGARLVGGTLFGGVIGLAAAAANCVIEEGTGKDVGEHVLALFQDDQPATAPTTTMVAQAQQSPEQTAAAATAVSSSPAKAAAEGAPVIALPENGPASAGSQPLVFSLDGMQQAATPAAVPGPDVASPAAPVVAAASAPLPLTRNSGRFLATPARKSVDAAPLPQVTVPVSNGSGRSNVPVTGRSPQAAAAATQRALAAQESAGGHPMLPPTDSNGQTAASPDWFTAAWGQALDKYQRANQRNDKAAPGAATSTLE